MWSFPGLHVQVEQRDAKVFEIVCDGENESFVPLAHSLEGVRVCIQFSNAPVEEAEVEEQHLQRAAALLLRASCARDVSESEALRRVCRHLAPYRALLRERWIVESPEEMVALLANDSLDDALVHLVDGSVALACTGFDAALDEAGIALLRRLGARTRSVDYRDGVICTFDVHCIRTLPFSSKRFEALVALGVFDTSDHVCRFGALVEERSSRFLAVPFDATPCGVLVAMASLLQIPEEPPVAECIDLEFGVVHAEAEGVTGHAPSTAVVGYRARIVKQRVVLQRDDDAISGESRSVDELDLAPRHESRVQRSSLEMFFPLLCSRIEARGGTIRACVWEVQARRAVGEWTLDAFDAGGHLSSLGGSVLLALSLHLWVGARTRVFCSRGGGASVGVWDGDAFVLYHPTWTSSSLFCAFAGTVLPPVPGVGKAVEVLFRTRWHVGIVRQLRRRLIQVSFDGGETRWVDAEATLVRPVAMDDDTDRVVRRFLRDK